MADSPAALATLTSPDSELFVGLVAPVGTNTKRFITTLQEQLKALKYKVKVAKLSDLLKGPLAEKLALARVNDSTEYERIHGLMQLGTQVRERTGRGDILALQAVYNIAMERTPREKPASRTAYVFDSLKHPEEVKALRRIYGTGFYLMGLYSPVDARNKHLTDDLGLSPRQAQRLVKIDENESKELGQRTQDTFHLADVFVTETEHPDQLRRFLQLILGNPYLTPTQLEHYMFLAHTAALRSADLSRQVGAVVASDKGEVLGIGCNDVPAPGGGLYWADAQDLDKRDYKNGYDPNEAERTQLIGSLYSKIEGLVQESDRAKLKSVLHSSAIHDITEYGRTVHAEMEAILSCTRTGHSLVNGTLYSTTFPCHNCARHIIAAGLKTVYYIEPYPKSRAIQLHEDAISALLPENWARG